MPGSISVTLMSVLGDLLAQRLAHRRDRPLGGTSRASRAARAGRPPSWSAARGRAFCSRKWASAGADRQRGAVDVGVDHRLPVLDATPRGSRAWRRSRRWRRRRRAAPKRSSAVATSACWSSQLGHVAAHGQRALRRRRAPRRAPRASPRTARPARRGSRTRTARRAVAAPMPLLAPVITRTGESAIAAVLAPDTLPAHGRTATRPRPAFPACPARPGTTRAST